MRTGARVWVLAAAIFWLVAGDASAEVQLKPFLGVKFGGSTTLSLGLASTAAYLAAYAANKDLLTVIEHQAISDPSIAVLWSEIQERPRRRVARYVRRMMAEGVACPAASPEVLSQGILGMFSRLGQSVPPGEKEFAALVRESTAMYLRLLGIAESAQEVPR